MKEEFKDHLELNAEMQTILPMIIQKARIMPRNKYRPKVVFASPKHQTERMPLSPFYKRISRYI